MIKGDSHEVNHNTPLSTALAKMLVHKGDDPDGTLVPKGVACSWPWEIERF